MMMLLSSPTIPTSSRNSREINYSAINDGGTASSPPGGRFPTSEKTSLSLGMESCCSYCWLVWLVWRNALRMCVCVCMCMSVPKVLPRIRIESNKSVGRCYPFASTVRNTSSGEAKRERERASRWCFQVDGGGGSEDLRVSCLLLKKPTEGNPLCEGSPRGCLEVGG
jgi:hypothetical protein